MNRWLQLNIFITNILDNVGNYCMVFIIIFIVFESRKTVNCLFRHSQPVNYKNILIWKGIKTYVQNSEYDAEINSGIYELTVLCCSFSLFSWPI